MKILMVCLGNICRSPLAQGILEEKCKTHDLSWEIDSAGTSSYHNGERPDSRSIDIALENGIDISSQRSRQVLVNDFQEYDLIIAMDRSNLNNLSSMTSSDQQISKLKLMMSFADKNAADVPDPYYNNGFSTVFQMINSACDALIKSYQRGEVLSSKN